MSHEDEGNYAAKHPEGTGVDPRAAELIRARRDGNKMSCADAHAVAQELGIDPLEVGKNLDLMEIRIAKCQLGLFGYAGPGRSIVEPAENVPQELRDKITAALENGTITCKRLWDIADGMGIPRIEGSAACEAMKIKVRRCQLGAF